MESISGDVETPRRTGDCDSVIVRSVLMWRRGWPASSSLRAAFPLPAPPCLGTDAGMASDRIDEGRGARSRSPGACRSTFRTTRRCASATKPSIRHSSSKAEPGAVAKLVGIEGGVVSGVMNLESPGVGAPGRRPRHDTIALVRPDFSLAPPRTRSFRQLVRSD